MKTIEELEEAHSRACEECLTLARLLAMSRLRRGDTLEALNVARDLAK